MLADDSAPLAHLLGAASMETGCGIDETEAEQEAGHLSASFLIARPASTLDVSERHIAKPLVHPG